MLSYTGLKPLIYAVSVLILLGSLALVILITCWIRVRRSYNRRHYRLATNPQDYLDYIGDNDLTPLASSELAASFEERPPSYSESEEMKNDSDTASSRETGRGQPNSGGGGGRIIESGLRRSRNLSSSILRQNSPDRNNGESSGSDRTTHDHSRSDQTIGTFLPPRQTLTLPRIVAAVRPPRPSAAANTNANAQFTSRSTTETTTSTTSSGDDISYLNTRNGNGTQGLSYASSEPIPQQSESNREVPVGMLIDLS